MCLADKFPESLPAFQRMFPDDLACARDLEAIRWRDGMVRTSGRIGLHTRVEVDETWVDSTRFVHSGRGADLRRAV